MLCVILALIIGVCNVDCSWTHLRRDAVRNELQNGQRQS